MRSQENHLGLSWQLRRVKGFFCVVWYELKYAGDITCLLFYPTGIPRPALISWVTASRSFSPLQNVMGSKSYKRIATSDLILVCSCKAEAEQKCVGFFLVYLGCWGPSKLLHFSKAGMESLIFRPRTPMASTKSSLAVNQKLAKGWTVGCYVAAVGEVLIFPPLPAGVFDDIPRDATPELSNHMPIIPGLLPFLQHFFLSFCFRCLCVILSLWFCFLFFLVFLLLIFLCFLIFLVLGTLAFLLLFVVLLRRILGRNLQKQYLYDACMLSCISHIRFWVKCPVPVALISLNWIRSHFPPPSQQL